MCVGGVAVIWVKGIKVHMFIVFFVRFLNIYKIIIKYDINNIILFSEKILKYMIYW